MSSSQVDLPLHHHSLNQIQSPDQSHYPLLPPTLPELPTTDPLFSVESFLGPPPDQPSHSQDLPRPVEDGRQLAKVQKRASLVKKRQSNVLKLSEENDKLKEELRAMTERLEAAERRRQELESGRGRHQSHVG